MKVAVVGGGVSGLVAAWLLRERHDVHLFEAAPRLGGHTRTVTVPDGRRDLPVDMGFIVYNERNYPLFSRLLQELRIETRPTSMGFSVKCERTGLEYGGDSLWSLFAQRRNLLRPAHYRMLLGILRFHREATARLRTAEGATLGDLVREARIPEVTVERYLVPMIAAIWSAAPSRVLELPAGPLLAFLANHGLLSVDDRPEWRTVVGGSRVYVDAIARQLGERVRLGSPVERVSRTGAGVELRVGGEAHRFDHVVLAVHSDQALRLLDRPTPAEAEVLAAIPYQENDVVLHTDERLLPSRPRARASWNYHLNAPGAEGLAQVTYSMNRLQGLASAREICVTLNRTGAIRPERILHRESFAHPVFSLASAAAQARWEEIHRGPVSYAGAWWGHGFHEDGVASAHRAAAAVAAAATVQEAVA